MKSEQLNSSAPVPATKYGNCVVTLVTSTALLYLLEHEWRGLVEQSDCTVFQTFEWVQSWWEEFSAGRELHCLLFRVDECLIGVAPLYVEKIHVPPLRPLRHLRIIGSPLSEYQNIIMKRGEEHSVADSLCKYLASHRREWDVLDIESVSDQSPYLNLIAGQLKENRLRSHIFQGSSSAQVSLPSSYEEYLSERDRGWRHELRRKWNLLCKNNSVEVELFTTPGEALRSGLKSFFEIHSNRWKSLGYPSEFDKDRVRNFHFSMADRFAQRGWFALSFLTVNGVRVATSVDFIYRGRVYVYQSQAFCDAQLMKASPGFLVKMKSIERAIAQQMKVYDLMRGEFAYKYRDFGAIGVKNWMIRTTSSDGRLRLRFRAFLAREFAVKMTKRLRKEFYESRRFKITHENVSFASVRYMASRVRELARLGKEYFRRNTQPVSVGAEPPSPDAPERNHTSPDRGTRRMEKTLNMRDLAPGTMVQVKSEGEIRATLDERGTLEGMPFMPEMVQYCGQRFPVSGWAHKTCVEGYGLRSLDRVVFLGDLRCSGANHDGCQRYCLMFWKTAWLRKCDERVSLSPIAGKQKQGSNGESYLTKEGSRYVCQSSELVGATYPLRWWSPKQYLYDVLSGQLTTRSVTSGVIPLVWEKARRLRGGKAHGRLQGLAVKTPSDKIALKPGDQVFAKTQGEIRATLDRDGKNRGLEFSAEMTPLCGRQFTVQNGVTKIILEQTGEMREIRDTVLLEGAFCDGVARRWCPRKNYFMWREIWLHKRDEPRNDHDHSA
jgi:CelD/BcsL family acetyltransferase involved in cellulose biosynthesis